MNFILYPRGRVPNNLYEFPGDSQKVSWSQPPRWGRFGRMDEASVRRVEQMGNARVEGPWAGGK